MITKTVESNLKKIRTKKAMNETKMAKACGLENRIEYSRLEKGLDEMTITQLIKICKTLDVGVADILTDWEKEYGSNQENVLAGHVGKLISVRSISYEELEKFIKLPENLMICEFSFGTGKKEKIISDRIEFIKPKEWVVKMGNTYLSKWKQGEKTISKIQMTTFVNESFKFEIESTASEIAKELGGEVNLYVEEW